MAKAKSFLFLKDQTLASCQMAFWQKPNFSHLHVIFTVFQLEADAPSKKGSYPVLLHCTRAMGTVDRIVGVSLWLD